MEFQVFMCSAGEAVSAGTSQVPRNADAVSTDDAMFAPLAGNGSAGRVVFTTQQSTPAVPSKQHPSSSEKKWCLIDIWQRPL